MSRPFNSARLKIRRAYEHLSAYEKQIDRFFKSKPYRITYRHNRKRTECTLKVTIRKPLPQDTLGPLIGDCVHNTRAALDHIIWDLAAGFSGPDPGDRDTQFPVYEARLYESTGVERPFSVRAERRIKRLPVYAQAFLEQLQPYHAAHAMSHPLILCRDFDDTDKHKLIPVVIAAVQTQGVNWSGGRILPIIEHRFREGPFENNAEVLWFRYATRASSNVKMKPDFTIVETLSDSAPFIDSRHILRRILHHVTRVIDAFENFPNHRSFLQIPSP